MVKESGPGAVQPSHLAGIVVVLGVVAGGCLLVFPVLSDTPDTAVTSVSGSVTVHYETPSGAGSFDADPVDPGLVTDGWAVIDRSALPSALAEVAGDPGSGVVPVGGMALVGSLEAASRPVGNATVTVVAPEGVDLDPARKAGFLSEFVSPYALGSADTEVTLVALPDVLPHHGAMYADGGGYVTTTAFWDGDVGSVWIHEFVHARQAFSLATEMGWFREASAEYFSYRMLQAQYDGVDNEDVLARLEASPVYPGSVLADETTWASEDVQYTRGVRLLYRIDAAIRSGSGGERTIFDVFRAMNERDGPITLDAFVGLVERNAGEKIQWLDAAITEPGPMDGYRNVDDVFAPAT